MLGHGDEGLEAQKQKVFESLTQEYIGLVGSAEDRDHTFRVCGCVIVLKDTQQSVSDCGESRQTVASSRTKDLPGSVDRQGKTLGKLTGRQCWFRVESMLRDKKMQVDWSWQCEKKKKISWTPPPKVDLKYFYDIIGTQKIHTRPYSFCMGVSMLLNY